MAQPGPREIIGTVSFGQFTDRELVGLRGSGGEGERDLAKAQLEQPVAARRLAVIVALGSGPGDDLDLPVVEPEAAIDRQYLRLDRALVGQEYPGRAALDDGGRDRAGLDIGEALGPTPSPWR